jgi:hypothetical protein
MASPAFGTAGTQLQGSGSTMNVDVPDSVASGDIIVVTAFIDGGTVTVSALPTGFAHAPDSPVSNAGAPAGAHSLAVMWKRATGSDSTASTYDFTLSGSTYRNAQAVRYTGAVGSGNPWDVTAPAAATTNSTTSPAVSDTTTVADTLLVWAGTNWSGGTWTPPTGFTERRDSGDGVCSVADKAQASAAGTGSITGTSTSSDKMSAWLGALKSTSGGTTFTISPTGSITPAGALVRQTNKTLAGSVTPSGVLRRTAGKLLAGATTPTGALVRRAGKALAGSTTPTGALVKQTSKTYAGVVAPSGSLSTIKAVLRSFAGSITPTGTLVRQTNKTLAGSVTPAGAIARLIGKLFAGSVTPTGSLSTSGGTAPVETNATSSPAVMARRTSIWSVLARRRSTPGVTARRTSTPDVSDGG